MTDFMKKEFAAMDAFQERLDKYGLRVNRGGISGRYLSNDCSVFQACIYSETYPMKGKKQLIEQIRQDGLMVNTGMKMDSKTGKNYRTFWVVGTARINTKEG